MIKQILGKGSVYAKKNKYGNRYWYLEVRYLDENDEQHKGSNKNSINFTDD